MEDLPGNLEKELTGRSLTKASRRRPRWTLLFVSDDGQTRPVHAFKGLFILLIGVLIASLGANGVFYLLYREHAGEKAELTAALNRSREQVDELRYEKDVLTARMVMREPEAAAPAAAAAATAPSPRPVEAGTRDASPASTAETPPPRTPATTTPAAPVAPEGDTPSEAADVPPPELVRVEDLSVSRMPARNGLRVRFIIRKADRDTDSVSGYAFVILRPSDKSQPDEWLVMPRAILEDGRPQPKNRGQYFSISRFKPMNFERWYLPDPEQYAQALVFVFDSSGNLLLEREYPIDIPPPPPKPPVRANADTSRDMIDKTATTEATEEPAAAPTTGAVAPAERGDAAAAPSMAGAPVPTEDGGGSEPRGDATAAPAAPADVSSDAADAPSTDNVSPAGEPLEPDDAGTGSTRTGSTAEDKP